MLALLRTRRWLSFTAAAVLAIVAFAILSNWQWLRAQEEEAKTDAVVAGSEAVAVPLSGLVAAGSGLPPGGEWRPVTVEGSLDCDRGWLVRNRPLEATNGLWAVCPLRTTDGAWIWINRGWLPAPGPAIQEVPMPPAAAGAVTVTGRLRSTESGPPLPPADLPAGQVTHLDTDVLSTISGLDAPTYEPYLDVTGMSPTDPAGLTALPLPGADSAQNYSYAGQWLLFAGIAVGGWFFFLRREAKDEAQRSAAAGADSEPQPTR